ncbi:GNAT family N-acetyltransferase [Lysobacter sp. 1R34A]|uniref:GNAT family N-acetyltransferase n=1 Tax=Lysobacter sp. 1R34A TaxID=3445786 RepID=UPI003EEB10C4
MIDLDSDHWTDALRDGLDAQIRRLPGQKGGSVACFRAGPFRVAYPDFLVGAQDISAEALAARIDAARGLRADLMRIQAERVCEDARVFARHYLGSIVIPALDEWNERGWEKARRAANRLARSELEIRPGRRGDGVHLHRLYLSTLHRHSGAARYTEAYFESIAPHAALVAVLNGTISGFVCTGFRGKRACYMHGAHLPEARGHYPSDQLFLAMLRCARDAGMSSFDFLPSPAGQGSLVAYKRAWGGSDAPLVVSDLALNPVRARAFAAALRLSNKLGSIRRGFTAG